MGIEKHVKVGTTNIIKDLIRDQGQDIEKIIVTGIEIIRMSKNRGGILVDSMKIEGNINTGEGLQNKRGKELMIGKRDKIILIIEISKDRKKRHIEEMIENEIRSVIAHQVVAIVEVLHQVIERTINMEKSIVIKKKKERISAIIMKGMLSPTNQNNITV